jgi:periplasmic protein CpxP/Spy
VKKQFILPAALLLALSSGTALSIGTAAAQAADAPAAQQQRPTHMPRHNRDFAAHLAGRIAYLKAELKITPAQEPAFDKLAQALRENAAERQKSFESFRASRGQPHSAVDRLETGVKLTQMRVQQDERYLAAFKPLYQSLSADQKKIADHMMTPHRWGHHRRGA